MDITAFLIEEIKDPTNIIEGERYEFLLDVEVEDDDELYCEAGLEIRAIVAKQGEDVRVVSYFLIDKADQSYLDFALEDEEEQLLLDFAKEQLRAEAEE